MEDKRRMNGGHSTKSKSGFDKRKNEYRQALEQASTVEDVVKVINMVKNKAIVSKDIQAAKLFLEYYLGKPEQSIDINSSEGFNLNFRELINFK